MTDFTPGAPPFVPADTRGKAVANEWWLASASFADSDSACRASSHAAVAIADLIDRERSMVEQAIRQQIGMFLSEIEGSVLSKSVIDAVLKK